MPNWFVKIAFQENFDVIGNKLIYFQEITTHKSIFVNANSKIYINITCFNSRIANEITNYRALDNGTMFFFRPTIFKIKNGTKTTIILDELTKFEREQKTNSEKCKTVGNLIMESQIKLQVCTLSTNR